MPGLDIARFTKLHGPLALFVAALAVGAGVHAPEAPERSLRGLATLLGEAADAEVAPEAIGWEPAPMFLVEALWGRPVLFLGAESPAGPRDLYRARVRVTLGGQPIEVTQIRNLTQTPLGDEAVLEVTGDAAVIATTAFGKIQGISVFDLKGVRHEDFVGGWLERALGIISAYGRTGSWSGLGRTDLLFDVPARSARLKLEPPELLIDLSHPQANVRYDIEARAATSTGEKDPLGPRVVPHKHGGRGVRSWLSDALRSAVGPVPVARLEQAALRLRNRFHGSGEAKADGAPPSGPPREQDPAVGRFPPPRITPLSADAPAAEGEWKPVHHDWLARPAETTAEPPPAFYTASLLASSERSDSKVHLVAMDMRQLELAMEAGYEHPHALTGPPGSGRLPEKDLGRVVAVFNGAFEQERGGGGMMVHRRTLVPPVPGAATVVVTRDGDVGFGTWTGEGPVVGGVVAFRQNVEPLLEDGVANPPERRVLGWRLNSPDLAVERTALCLTQSRQVIYAWASAVTGKRLGEALERAGCQYAVHLDMSPKPCGFAFAGFDGETAGSGRAELLHPEMSIEPMRLLRGWPRDFFYVRVRDFSRLRTGQLEFSPTESQQPPPGWLPALYQATRRLGELEVTVYAFEKGRFDWVVRAGKNEPPAIDKRPKKTSLESDEFDRVLGAVNLGHTTDATRYGLAFEGGASFAMRRSYATLVLEQGRSPRIVAPGKRPKLTETQDAVQLPMLADDGKLLPRARDQGAMRLRAALCVSPEGRTLVALSHHDSDHPVVQTLVDAGCDRVVGLDRGSKHPAFLHLSETETAPQPQYETTVLYVLGRPMIPGAFRWRPRPE